MRFIEREIFDDKRRNLTALERLQVHFFDTIIWCNLLKGSSSTIREGTWRFTKGSRSILFARSRDVIYWIRTLQLERRNLTVYDGTDRFYWQEAVMIFIKGERFPDKRKNLTVLERFPVDFSDTIIWWHLLKGNSSTKKRKKLTVYERLSVEFISTESWWNLFKGGSSTKREGIWLFTKGSSVILLDMSRDGVYWMRALSR
jgi:hypothetical protein